MHTVSGSGSGSESGLEGASPRTLGYNAYLDSVLEAQIGVDTAENEPSKVCPILFYLGSIRSWDLARRQLDLVHEGSPLVAGQPAWGKRLEALGRLTFRQG